MMTVTEALAELDAVARDHQLLGQVERWGAAGRAAHDELQMRAHTAQAALDAAAERQAPAIRWARDATDCCYRDLQRAVADCNGAADHATFFALQRVISALNRLAAEWTEATRSAGLALREAA